VKRDALSFLFGRPLEALLWDEPALARRLRAENKLVQRVRTTNPTPTQNRATSAHLPFIVPRQRLFDTVSPRATCPDIKSELALHDPPDTMESSLIVQILFYLEPSPPPPPASDGNHGYPLPLLPLTWSTYPSVCRVLLTLSAFAMALAPSSPMLLYCKLFSMHDKGRQGSPQLQPRHSFILRRFLPPPVGNRGANIPNTTFSSPH